MQKFKQSLPEITLKYKSGKITRKKLLGSKDTYELLMEMYDSDTLEYIESFIVLYLNKANETIGWQKVSYGGTSSTIADVKVIMSSALLSGAHAIILSHNHPSGNKKPSEADCNLTKKIIKAGKLLDILVLDHLIITQNGYYSFGEEGEI